MIVKHKEVGRMYVNNVFFIFFFFFVITSPTGEMNDKTPSGYGRMIQRQSFPIHIFIAFHFIILISTKEKEREKKRVIADVMQLLN